MEQQESKPNTSKLLTVLVGITLVISLVSLYTVSSLKNQFEIITGGAVADAPTQPTQAAPKKVTASADDDPVKGDKSAPVEIIEFSDFECPFCARFYSDTLQQIQKEYIDTGKVKLVYRDYPLSFHANAQKAAEASECADDQGKFWEMHDLMFSTGVQGGVATFKAYAKQLGLKQADFDSCLDSGKYYDEVQKDMKEGASYGVTGTPGFIINGNVIVGAQPFAVFKQVIDQELAKN